MSLIDRQSIKSILYAVCPGGEGADLKSVGCKRLAGSNPVHGATVLLVGRDE